MRKAKTKFPTTFDELLNQRYGVAVRSGLRTVSQFDDLIARYYGNPGARRKRSQKAQAETLLSLSFDPGEVLPQRSPGRYTTDEYVVHHSVVAPFEEYVVDAGAFAHASSLDITESGPQAEDAEVQQEYLVDVRRPLEEIVAPEPIATPALPQPAAPTPPILPSAQPPPVQGGPALPQAPETSQAMDDEFLADMKAILEGKKLFDPAQKKTVEKEKLPSAQSTASPSPDPDARRERDIFDRIAESMQYAKAYDLGTVVMENRFKEFDDLFDLQQKANQRKAPPGALIPAAGDTTLPAVDSTDFILDLDAIHQARAEKGLASEAVAASLSGAETAAAGSESATIPEIENLNLAETAKKAAYALKKKHPAVVFTSGRRSKPEQASAMAGNVVANRKWIEQTYTKSDVRDACQKWVDDNPDQQTKEDIALGLTDVLDRYTEAQLAVLSKHISGMAFDVQPVADGEDIIHSIKALEGLDRFLEEEGGLVRWHAQFK